MQVYEVMPKCSQPSHKEFKICLVRFWEVRPRPSKQNLARSSSSFAVYFVNRRFNLFSPAVKGCCSDQTISNFQALYPKKDGNEWLFFCQDHFKAI